MHPRLNKPYEGLFLTIEGGDGCGKSTLAAALKAYLEKGGAQVLHTREPGGSKLAEEIRSLVLTPPGGVKISPKAELLLFLSARADHLDQVILPALHEGKIVLCERFHDSTVAYQGYARHLGAQTVEDLCALSSACMMPDVTFLLDIDPEVGLKRAAASRQSADRLEQEKLQFHREVRQGFLHLADKYRERIVVIDAELPAEKVLEQAVAALQPCLSKR